MNTREVIERGLIDTNTLIMLERIAGDQLPSVSLISAITLAELSVGPLVADSPEEQAVRQAHLQRAEADFETLPFTAQTARTFGQVSASLRRNGRKSSARSMDAMIAATAMANRLPLYTCNIRDFDGIDGLEVIAVSPDNGPSQT